MQSVGTRLREARERKGVSLEEINARTRINAKNLVAIEHDEVRNISSPFFYRSFVRQYAEQVGLDFQSLSPSVEALAGHMRQPDLPGQGEHQPVRVAPVQPRPKHDYTWMKPAGIVAALCLLLSGTFAGWSYFAPLVHHAASTSAAHSVPPAPAVPVKALKTAAQSPAPASDKIHLELSVTERTWLSVSADGKQAYSGILEPAQTKILDGQESARLRTGNAGGVSIHFNGKDIGVIGPRGKTRTVVFTKTGYAVEPGNGSTILHADHIGG